MSSFLIPLRSIFHLNPRWREFLFKQSGIAERQLVPKPVWVCPIITPNAIVCKQPTIAATPKRVDLKIQLIILMAIHQTCDIKQSRQ